MKGLGLQGFNALVAWTCESLLGGSGVVISRVISPLVWVISIVNLLMTLLITTHEPPSSSRVARVRSLAARIPDKSRSSVTSGPMIP